MHTSLCPGAGAAVRGGRPFAFARRLRWVGVEELGPAARRLCRRLGPLPLQQPQVGAQPCHKHTITNYVNKYNGRKGSEIFLQLKKDDQKLSSCFVEI